MSRIPATCAFLLTVCGLLASPLHAAAFHKVDKSRLQGFVVVKHPGDLAAIHYVNVVKDHLAGDSVQAYFPNSVKGEPPVENLVLIKNAK